MPVPIYTPNGWVDDDGSGTTGTLFTAGRMNSIESGIAEASRAVRAVRVAATVNVVIAGPGAAIDGVNLAAGDRVLLAGQTTTSQNGIYVWNGAAVAMTRALDADTAAKLLAGQSVVVREGAANGGRDFVLATDQPAIGASAIAFVGSVAIPTVYALPQTPADGDQVFYVADQTNGVTWHLRYRGLQQNGTANPSPYKWEYVGGGQLYSEVGPEETTASLNFVDLTTVGPQVTCPLAGEYLFGGFMDVYASQADGAPYAALKIGAAAVSGGDRLILDRTGQAAGVRGSIGGRPIKRTVAANTVCKIQYQSGNNNGNVTFGNRVLLATPARVG